MKKGNDEIARKDCLSCKGDNTGVIKVQMKIELPYRSMRNGKDIENMNASVGVYD